MRRRHLELRTAKVTSRGGALFFFGFGASRDYSSRSDHEARARETSRKKRPENSR